MRERTRRLCAIETVTMLCGTGTAQKIGDEFAIGATSAARSPDVAYSIVMSRYLSVWEQAVGMQTHIRGQFVSSTGSLSGGPFSIASGIGKRQAPSVAYVMGNGLFVVAWQEKVGFAKWKIRARSINPINGAMSAIATLAEGGAIEPCLSGTKVFTSGHAILAWTAVGLGIRVVRVLVPKIGAPVRSSGVGFVTNNATAHGPALPRSGGTSNRRVIVYVIDRKGTYGRDIYARAIDANAAVVGSEIEVTDLPSDQFAPAIAGDGAKFLVAWQSRQSAASSRHDVGCRRVLTDGTKATVSGAPASVASSSAYDETAPAVGLLRHAFTVAWAEKGGVIPRTRMKLRPFSLVAARPCGWTQTVSGPRRHEVAPAIGARQDGGSTGQDALLVINTLNQNASYGEVIGQRIEAFGQGGPIVDLGGGCGNGGSLTTDGPFTFGNPFFRLRLTGAGSAVAAPIALLNIAPNVPVFATCGPCAITPPTALLPMPLAGRNGALLMPVPCDLSLAGVRIQAQAYVLQSEATPCPGLPGISFSNRLRATLN